ncbi:hypothetical protein RN629_09300 [Sphingomonadaceae bacterium jetA1]|jgi:hypothetical protein|uniref:hypothetical protein n=1 Tax=Facivitalis istanbulensis TaxID=3075838 RepID=UPI00346F077D
MTRMMFRAHGRAHSLATVMSAVPLERARLLRAIASTRPQAVRRIGDAPPEGRPLA